MKEYLTFDDVLIQPSYSDIESRDEISTALNFLGLDLKLPIISAAMDFVTGPEMATVMEIHGALGFMHRFDDKPLMAGTPRPLKSVISVGTKDINQSISRVACYRPTEYLFGVNIDVAHGEHAKVIELTSELKKRFPNVKIMAGNVATWVGASRLIDAGADAIKIGIGPGSVCTTREVTGIGVPQFTAIQDIYEKKRSLNWAANIPLIADGGMKTSGDIVKALAAGADAVMLGYMLAGATETPGKPFVGPNGQLYKRYRGQASFGSNGTKYSPEGIEGMVPFSGPVADTLKKISGGLRSGMSYVGARNLQELRENAEFIRVSPNTRIESGTRVENYDERYNSTPVDLYNGANPSRRE